MLNYLQGKSKKGVWQYTMMMPFGKNVLYQQILLNYFTNKIKDESSLLQELKNRSLETEFIYKKAAYITVSIKKIVKDMKFAEDTYKLLDVILREFESEELLSVPLYFSANEIKMCIISFNEVSFEDNLDFYVKKFLDALKEQFGTEGEIENKMIFATLKELKLNMVSLFFENFTKTKVENQIILKAKMYIEKNYMKKLSLDDISKHLGITPYYFCRMFKKETGVNFANYLTEVRLNQSKKLLRETNLSNREISKIVGIGSANYFHQLFKNYTGLTPSEFRNIN